MKVKDADILIIPGYTNSGPDHWQTRWESKLSTARRVQQAEWTKPVREDWIGEVVKAANAATKPIVLVAHSLGVATAVHAMPHIQHKIAGAFFVAPPDVSNEAIRPKHLMTFGPYPRERLPFPTITVVSRNDPFSSFEAAEEVVKDWGAMLIDAGDSGHINSESGHGPWPEGSMVFAEFMTQLQAPKHH